YAAGLALGVWDESIFDRMRRVKYEPKMEEAVRTKKYSGWKAAVSSVLTK
ncbi:glycerol kinase, partial [Clostridium sp. AF15-17LB]